MRVLRAFLSSASISRVVGRVVSIGLPFPLSYLVIKVYCLIYGVNINEAELPLKEYKSLGEFFTRKLRPGLRPIDNSLLISPIDGLLRGAGRLGGEGLIEQVKGKNYRLENLLNDRASAAQYKNGIYFNFYLGPRDYHHVHSPIDGGVTRVVYIPGRLLPVNEWTASNVADLYPGNERVVVYLETQKGMVALVMVGALNVGKISLNFKPDFFSNYSLFRNGFDIEFEKPVPLAAGEPLGTFHMGSAVVLLLPPEFTISDERLSSPLEVKYGRELLPLT